MLVGKTFLITLFALFGVAISIKCLSCDSDVYNCTNHVSIDCPNHSKCYTLTRNGTKVLAKGCTHSCNFVTFRTAAFCKECYHKDYCNGPGVAIGSSGILSYRVPRGYDVGVTVRIQSAAYNSVFTILMFFLVLHCLL
ncbi:unnamed protein product [Caenorhabditis brenneri]